MVLRQSGRQPCDTDVLRRRCDSCHLNREISQDFHPDKPNNGLDPNGRPYGVGVWPGQGNLTNPRWDAHINLDYPEKSLLLRAPLAKTAGGLGWCRNAKAESSRQWYGIPKPADNPPALVFEDVNDSDYGKLLASLQGASRYFKTELKRFNVPGFVPNRNLFNNLVRSGVVPAGHDPARAGWDPYRIDELYFRHAAHLSLPDITLGQPAKPEQTRDAIIPAMPVSATSQ